MAIIGISGKKSSGKDLTCVLLQFLFLKDRLLKNGQPMVLAGTEAIALHAFRRWSTDERRSHSGWERKFFAEKLKQIVCLLIGCTMEQLESNTFKNKPLGEEWRFWYWTYYKLKTSNNPRGQVSKLYATYEECQADEKNLQFDPQFVTENFRMEDELLTPRTLMQYLGTDAGRKIVHPNIWVNVLMSDYNPMGYKTDNIKIGMIHPTEGMAMQEIPNTAVDRTIYPNWIITDVRFPNEVAAIESKGGIVIRVNRQQKFDRTCLDCTQGFDFVNWVTEEQKKEQLCPNCQSMNHAAIFYETDTHESETALDDYQRFAAVINNPRVGGVNALLEEVKQIAQQLKLV